MIRQPIFSAALVVLLFAGPSFSATIIGDEATFQGATGAAAEAPLPDLGFLGNTPTTVGNLTFSVFGAATNFYIGLDSGGVQWSTDIAGEEIAISGPENLRIQSSVDLTAIGFYFDQPTIGPGIFDACNVPTCTDSIFDFQFNLDGALVDIVAGYMPGDDLSYLGFDVGLIFDEVLIFDVSGTVDNEFFGGFSTALAPAVVPLPATLPLLLVGFGALGLARRRQRQ